MVHFLNYHSFIKNETLVKILWYLYVFSPMLLDSIMRFVSIFSCAFSVQYQISYIFENIFL